MAFRIELGGSPELLSKISALATAVSGQKLDCSSQQCCSVAWFVTHIPL